MLPTSTVASQRIADHLRAAILSGALAPGTRIRQEDLAASLGSSRLPVREALRIMESEGLIVIKPNSGAWVSRLDRKECEDIYKIRERLEPLALAESIPHLTPAQMDALEVLQEQIEANDDPNRFLILDREFHLTTYEGCAIEQLSALVRRSWNTTQHYRRAYARLVDDSGRQVINYEHRLLLDAVRRGDTVDAEHFLASHIRRTRLALARHAELFTPHEVA
ncbi:GntR family transcriptional regulator [Streptomyces sp. NPDC004376]